MVKKANARLLFVCVAVGIFAVAVFIRLVWLQVFQYKHLYDIAYRQQTSVVKIDHERGSIIDRNGLTLAGNLPAFSIYANPRQIKAKEETATKLSAILGMSSADILDKIDKDKGFIWLKRKISGDEKRAIEDADIRGVAAIKEYRRLYPQESMGCQMLGYVDIDNQGLEGLERKYNKYLSSNQGEAIVVRDSRGKDLPLYKELSQGSDGFDLHLNIDAQIQYWCDTILAQAVEKNRADGGAVVIMDPRDGRVLALSNAPHFDPNKPGDGNPAGKRDRAVSDFYEPGSVFKTVTLAMAIENLKNYKSRSYFCENGLYKIPGSLLHDWHPFGMLPFEGVFINSSNIGIVKIVQDIGPQKVNTYVHKFAFGEATGIDLPAETTGYVKPYKYWSKTSPYIVPIGQEVTVSVVQLARMLSAVVNGGHLVKPFVVSKIVDKKGVTIKEFKPEIKGQVIAQHTSDEARRILQRVVDEGTGKKAQVKGMTLGGKTGTAQKAVGGHYSKKDFYVSFTGFFPVENPQYVLVVTVDNPRGAFHTGGMVAAPIAGAIANKIADYAHLRKIENPVVLTPDKAEEPVTPKAPVVAVKVPVIAEKAAVVAIKVPVVAEKPVPVAVKAPIMAAAATAPLVVKPVITEVKFVTPAAAKKADPKTAPKAASKAATTAKVSDPSATKSVKTTIVTKHSSSSVSSKKSVKTVVKKTVKKTNISPRKKATAKSTSSSATTAEKNTKKP